MVRHVNILYIKTMNISSTCLIIRVYFFNIGISTALIINNYLFGARINKIQLQANSDPRSIFVQPSKLRMKEVGGRGEYVIETVCGPQY